MKQLSAVSFGGGVNSTALLLGLLERGERPDFILFADTGNEFEDTYAFVDMFAEWLIDRGFPGIVRIKRAYQRHKTLEHECHNLKTLPSLAFGYKGCSVKWKRQPMDSWLKKNPKVQAELKAGRRIQRLIGIDYGEQHRGQIPDDKWFTYHKPLVDWKWAREECIAAIERHGLAIPRKSACFFCPAMKKQEVLTLAAERPDLYGRAVAMERIARNAGNIGVETTVGLGRRWSWEELVTGGIAKPCDLPESGVEDCMCSDGAID